MPDKGFAGRPEVKAALIAEEMEPANQYGLGRARQTEIAKTRMDAASAGLKSDIMNPHLAIMANEVERIAELEDELEQRDRRIGELKTEIDELRESNQSPR